MFPSLCARWTCFLALLVVSLHSSLDMPCLALTAVEMPASDEGCPLLLAELQLASWIATLTAALDES